MMNAELDKLAALTNELIDENDALRAELKEARELNKSASVETEPIMIVKQASGNCMDATCRALVSAGLINEDQVELTKQAFINDPEAVHRTIQAVLDAQAQVKNASSEQDLSGGKLVGGSSAKADVYDSSINTMQRILGIVF